VANVAERKSNSRQSGSRNGKPTGTRVVARAKEQLGELIGRPVEGALGMRRTDDGWEVVVEVVELHRVPDTTDVLASYAVALDQDGELVEYRRTRRYYRNQADEE
jgi:Gas vesicle synthesis protein GvpO